MRQSSTRLIAWLAGDAAIKRTLAIVCLLLLLAVLPAWGSPGRAIYDSGNLHRVYLDSNGNIKIDIGVQKNGIFPNTSSLYTDSFTTYPSSYQVCRTYKSTKVQNPGESVANFNNQIFYVYAANTPGWADSSTSCLNSAATGMSVWVAVFDLKTLTWTSNRALGSVSVINTGQGSGAGAAIAVFDNLLFVFTDSHTYRSTDGLAWSTFPAVYNNISYEPLDAVAIDPPGGTPQVLIVFGRQAAVSNTYAELISGTWDGDMAHALANVVSISTAPTYGRLALIAGTASGSKAPDWGLKSTVVQLFDTVKASSSTAANVRHLEYSYYYFYGAYQQQWRNDTQSYATSVQDMLVYLTSFTDCFENSDYFAGTQALRQAINLNWKDSAGQNSYAFRSDALVPQNRDIPMTACGSFGGTTTDTATGDPNDPTAAEVRKHYWTLLGVVLGSPPFAVNDYTATTDYKDFSTITYGKSAEESVDHGHTISNSFLFSAGGDIHWGMRGVYSNSISLDFNYKHTWNKQWGDVTTTTIKDTRIFGTSQSAYTELGKWGWALFNAPIMLVQNWEIYAYDYDPSSGFGTKLNQALHTISAVGYNKQMVSFDLANPGGPDGKGIMAGMQSFSCSRDLNYWYHTIPYNWQTDARWVTKLGEADLTTLQFAPGGGTEQSYTSTAAHYDVNGQTNDISFMIGETFKFGSKFGGFSAYAKAGYARNWGWSTRTTTTFGSQVVFSLKMKSCNVAAANCVTSLSVQPYWLEAARDDAPWIPAGFKNDKPWAITWKVKGAVPDPVNAPFDCTLTPPATSSTGVTLASSRLVPMILVGSSRAGTAPAPLNASGRIVSGNGGGDAGEPYSHYSIQGGRLSWIETGTETRIPMTADDFDPSRGVSLEVNSAFWSSVGAKGSWSRSGEIWRFDSQGDVEEDRVTMKLDFASATYDLQIQKVDLNGRVPAGVRTTKLVVDINGRYRFFTPLRHDVDISWQWRQPAPDADKMHVTSFQGRYNTATGAGKMSIGGTLPKVLPAFGDLSIDLNEHPHLAQLINLPGFDQAVDTGGIIRYAKEGANLVIDFGQKTWSATFNEKAFNELVAPRAGTIRALISVGGVPMVKAENAVLDYSANLKLAN